MRKSIGKICEKKTQPLIVEEAEVLIMVDYGKVDYGKENIYSRIELKIHVCKPKTFPSVACSKQTSKPKKNVVYKKNLQTSLWSHNMLKT